MHIYQFHRGPILKIYQDCIDQVKGMLRPEDTYMFMSDHGYFNYDGMNVRVESDVLRCYILANDSEAMWVDTDIRILKWPEITGDRPWSTAHCAIMACNKNQHFFTNLLTRREAVADKDKPGWLQHLMGCPPQTAWNLIPDNCYRHLALGFTTKPFIWKMISNTDRVITNDSGNLTLTWLRGV